MAPVVDPFDHSFEQKHSSGDTQPCQKESQYDANCRHDGNYELPVNISGDLSVFLKKRKSFWKIENLFTFCTIPLKSLNTFQRSLTDLDRSLSVGPGYQILPNLVSSIAASHASLALPIM